MGFNVRQRRGFRRNAKFAKSGGGFLFGQDGVDFCYFARYNLCKYKGLLIYDLLYVCDVYCCDSRVGNGCVDALVQVRHSGIQG